MTDPLLVNSTRALSAMSSCSLHTSRDSGSTTYLDSPFQCFCVKKIPADVSTMHLEQHLEALSTVKLQLFPRVQLWIRFFWSFVFETALHIVKAQSFK